MSAGTLGFDREGRLRNRQNSRAGYTSISAGTMNQLVAAIAADAFHVPLPDVRASLHDEQGQISVSLAVPLATRTVPEGSGPTLFSTPDGGTLLEWAASGRAVVARRMQVLSGSTVGRVDVRFTGIHNPERLNAGRVK